MDIIAHHSNYTFCGSSLILETRGKKSSSKECIIFQTPDHIYIPYSQEPSVFLATFIKDFNIHNYTSITILYSNWDTKCSSSTCVTDCQKYKCSCYIRCFYIETIKQTLYWNMLCFEWGCNKILLTFIFDLTLLTNKIMNKI